MSSLSAACPAPASTRTQIRPCPCVPACLTQTQVPGPGPKPFPLPTSQHWNLPCRGRAWLDLGGFRLRARDSSGEVFQRNTIHPHVKLQPSPPGSQRQRRRPPTTTADYTTQTFIAEQTLTPTLSNSAGAALLCPALSCPVPPATGRPTDRPINGLILTAHPHALLVFLDPTSALVS